MTTTLADVRRANTNWFSRSNKRFFGDCGYKVLTAKSGQKYLVRLSGAWSDMFGRPKSYNYYLNPINPDLSIGTLVDGPDGCPLKFADLDDVKEWLRDN